MEEKDPKMTEMMEKIKNLEKRNQRLKAEIETKKIKIIEWEKNILKINHKEKENQIKPKTKNYFISQKEDKNLGETFLKEININKNNIEEIEDNIKNITIKYSTQEFHRELYITGDFTNWELRPMDKVKGIFIYETILLKGYKYYYHFQINGEEIIDYYNSPFQQNPKTLEVQNYLDLSENKENPPQFDFDTDMKVLESYRNKYYLSKININEDNEREILFLDKFKRHIVKSNEMLLDKNLELYKLNNSINKYYDKLYIEPYDKGNIYKSLKSRIYNRVLVHYDTNLSKTKKIKYFFKIINFNDNIFQCMKLYDNNNIKINISYYTKLKYFYSIKSSKISTHNLNLNKIDDNLYYLLSEEESEKILDYYKKDNNNIIKAYFKTLKNLKRYGNEETENLNRIREDIYNQPPESFIVIPNRIEPIGININDYEFLYSMNRITKVKNKKEGSYVEFEAIDETVEKEKKPVKFKIYYNIKDDKINIIHCHAIENSLQNIKIEIKEIHKYINPHILKKKEEYVKKDELLLIVVESNPIKLYYKGKKVKMECIKLEENKLYLVETKDDYMYNKMYVTINKIENKEINKDLEDNYICNEYLYKFDNIKNGVEVELSYDNNKKYIKEKKIFCLTPCILSKLSTYEENALKSKNENSEEKNLNEIDKYLMIKNKMKDYKKYNKEKIDKMEQNEKQNILSILKDYKESMNMILNFIQINEMWEVIDDAINLSKEIEDLIVLF